MSALGLLRARRFGPLFWTQFLGAFNDNVYRFALIIFVTFTVAERTGMDTRMLVVMTGAVFIAPFFLFSSLAGQIADKHEKSRLIRRIKSAEIAVMGLGAVGFWLGHYPFLLGVLFLMGVQSTFFGPLKYGVLPQHLEPAELTAGNGLIQLGTYVAILVGGMCGGVLASLGDLAPAAIVAAVVGLAVMGRIAAGFIPRAPANDATITVDWNLPRSTWQILGESVSRRTILILIVLISMFWFAGATFLSVVPSYGKDLLNADERSVTLLNAAFTLGIGIGSLACNRLSGSRIELGLVPLAGLGLSIAALDIFLAGIPGPRTDPLTVSAFFAHPPALRLFVDLTAIGTCGALYIVPLYAALQARVEAAWCARMLAALNISNALFMVASAGFTMALYASGVSAPGVFGAVALLNVLVVAGGMRAMPELGLRAKAILLRRSPDTPPVAD